MERERTLQVVLALMGLFYVALIYPLYTDLGHSKWLLERSGQGSAYDDYVPVCSNPQQSL